jgi:mannose-1-phosphate guanylyltransferase
MNIFMTGDNVERSYAVVMAGGRGERFWPLSTGKTPKPFLPILGGKTMIQLTVERIKPLIPFERILVVVGKEHLKAAQEQLPELPEENFLVEPIGKDTAPCIGFASLHIERRDPDGIMVVMASDHHIPDQEKFLSSLSAAIQLLSTRDNLITLGIKPVRPETGYGYIEAKERMAMVDTIPFFKVKRFVEKPDLDRAKKYVKRKDFFWNSGIFVWRNKTIQDLLKNHLPELWQGLSRIREHLDSDRVVSKEFKLFPRISIDYGVLEKAKDILVIPAEFRWDDVGTWVALDRVYQLDKNGNAVIGKHVSIDTRNCVIHSQDHFIATIGLSNLVIVQANGKLLICSKERGQDVKELLKLL